MNPCCARQSSRHGSRNRFLDATVRTRRECSQDHEDRHRNHPPRKSHSIRIEFGCTRSIASAGRIRARGPGRRTLPPSRSSLQRQIRVPGSALGGASSEGTRSRLGFAPVNRHQGWRDSPKNGLLNRPWAAGKPLLGGQRTDFSTSHHRLERSVFHAKNVNKWPTPGVVAKRRSRRIHRASFGASEVR